MAVTRMLLIQITKTIFGSFMLWQSLSVIIILVLGIWLEHEPINSTQGRKVMAASSGTVADSVEWTGHFKRARESDGADPRKADFVVDKKLRSLSIFKHPRQDSDPLHQFFITADTEIALPSPTEVQLHTLISFTRQLEENWYLSEISREAALVFEEAKKEWFKWKLEGKTGDIKERVLTIGSVSIDLTKAKISENLGKPFISWDDGSGEASDLEVSGIPDQLLVQIQMIIFFNKFPESKLFENRWGEGERLFTGFFAGRGKAIIDLDKTVYFYSVYEGTDPVIDAPLERNVADHSSHTYTGTRTTTVISGQKEDWGIKCELNPEFIMLIPLLKLLKKVYFYTASATELVDRFSRDILQKELGTSTVDIVHQSGEYKSLTEFASNFELHPTDHVVILDDKETAWKTLDTEFRHVYARVFHSVGYENAYLFICAPYIVL